MMDPLGAVSNVTDINNLTLWGDTTVPEYDIIIDNPESKKQSPFEYDPSVNRKIILWLVG